MAGFGQAIWQNLNMSRKYCCKNPLCSRGPLFQHPLSPGSGSSIPSLLHSQGSTFHLSYVPSVLCSQCNTFYKASCSLGPLDSGSYVSRASTLPKAVCSQASFVFRALGSQVLNSRCPTFFHGNIITCIFCSWGPYVPKLLHFHGS